MDGVCLSLDDTGIDQITNNFLEDPMSFYSISSWESDHGDSFEATARFKTKILK